MATLLSIVQDAATEIGIGTSSSITSVIGNSDDKVATLLAMSNREGRDLVRAHDWTVLQKVHTFSTVASTATYSLPSDYSRLLNESEWNRGTYRPLIGPVNAQEWQTIKSGLFGQGVVDTRYRIIRDSSGTGRLMELDPTPDSVETIAYEYISNQWCASSGGTGQTEWAADTDIPLLPEDLNILGLIVRWKRAKGYDFASEADEYMQMLDAEIAQDRPSPDLSLTERRSAVHFLGIENLPETGLP